MKGKLTDGTKPEIGRITRCFSSYHVTSQQNQKQQNLFHLEDPALPWIIKIDP